MLRLSLVCLWPLLMGLVLVRADHKTCSWQPSGNSEPGKGWSQFCTAVLSSVTANGAGYACDNTEVWGSSVLGTAVASYHAANNLFYTGTPCGHGGFGFDPSPGQHYCLSASWVVCAHFSPGHQQCFGLNKADDCEWPSHGKPDYVKVFYFGINPQNPPEYSQEERSAAERHEGA
ncbi:unnamed protein product [Parajaminaea phylloscopi]